MLFLTLVLAVIAVDGNTPETLIVAVRPLVVPLPITVLPLYNVTVEPLGTPSCTVTTTFCPFSPAFSLTELCSITGVLGLTFSVAVAEFDELSEYVAVTLYLNIPAVLVLGCPFVQFQCIPPGKFLVSSFRTTKSDATGLLTSPRESPTVFVTSFPFIGYNCASDLVSNLVPVAAYTYA